MARPAQRSQPAIAIGYARRSLRAMAGRSIESGRQTGLRTNGMRGDSTVAVSICRPTRSGSCLSLALPARTKQFDTLTQYA